VLANDFFLGDCLDEFREGARLLMFEMFCRVHKSISIKVLASRLGMGEVSPQQLTDDTTETVDDKFRALFRRMLSDGSSI
jgi:translation initiation factor 3 subunit E